MLKRREIELVCGACEGVFARVRVRPLALGMDVHSLITGGVTMPRPGYSVNEEARQRLTKAETAGFGDELDSARSVVAYLRRMGGDIVYDMTCWCKRRYVRTSPHLYREVNATKGRWLTLSPGTATWPPAEF